MASTIGRHLAPRCLSRTACRACCGPPWAIDAREGVCPFDPGREGPVEGGIERGGKSAYPLGNLGRNHPAPWSPSGDQRGAEAGGADEQTGPTVAPTTHVAGM